MKNYPLEGAFQALADVQTKEQDVLLEFPNVIGVALGYKQSNRIMTDEPSLLVLVNQKLGREYLHKDELVPTALGKFKTDVVEIGQVFAQTQMLNNDRMRPVMGGCEIRNVNANFLGTLATTVIPKGATMPNRYFMLTNNHVIASTGSGIATFPLGSHIIQPSSGADPADWIASLSNFVPIAYNAAASNVVDCALAEIREFDKCSPEIYGIGYVNGVVNPQLDMRVQKSGRTTGYTRGRILGINATVVVGYSNGPARFVGQIMTTPMLQPGDSGSLLLDMNNNAVGLCFAGSDQASFANPIMAVLNALHIEFLGV
jgi:S1-C subfamily serine protease